MLSHRSCVVKRNFVKVVIFKILSAECSFTLSVFIVWLFCTYTKTTNWILGKVICPMKPLPSFICWVRGWLGFFLNGFLHTRLKHLNISKLIPNFFFFKIKCYNIWRESPTGFILLQFTLPIKQTILLFSPVKCDLWLTQDAEQSWVNVLAQGSRSAHI